MAKQPSSLSDQLGDTYHLWSILLTFSVHKLPLKRQFYSLYISRVVIYERNFFVRLATGLERSPSSLTKDIIKKSDIKQRTKSQGSFWQQIIASLANLQASLFRRSLVSKNPVLSRYLTAMRIVQIAPLHLPSSSLVKVSPWVSRSIHPSIILIEIVTFNFKKAF